MAPTGGNSVIKHALKTVCLGVPNTRGNVTVVYKAILEIIVISNVQLQIVQHVITTLSRRMNIAPVVSRVIMDETAIIDAL